jgi:DNA-binding Lrp family transcriptional regulator
MAVFRVERTKDYTVMSNHHLRDKSLSLKAKGLLSQMLSLPENWDYTLAGLAQINKESKDAISTAVRELEQRGYIQRRQSVDAKGKFGKSEYVIYEHPMTNKPSPENPPSGDPPSEPPTPGKPAQLNIDTRKIDQKNTDLSNIQSYPIRQDGTGQRKSSGLGAETMEAYGRQLRDNIEYPLLITECGCDVERVDELVDLMLEVLCSCGPVIRVASQDYPAQLVKSRMLQINRQHILDVLQNLDDNRAKSPIKDMKQYLKTMLFNAAVCQNNYYAAMVARDLAGGIVATNSNS